MARDLVRRLIPAALVPLAAVAIVVALRPFANEDAGDGATRTSGSGDTVEDRAALTLPQLTNDGAELRVPATAKADGADATTGGALIDLSGTNVHILLLNQGNELVVGGTCSFAREDEVGRRSAPGCCPGLELQSDEAGYVSTWLEPGRWVVEARADGLFGAPQTFEVTSGGFHFGDIMLLPMDAVVGHVLDARTRAPVPDAYVWSPSSGTNATTRTDAEGAFRFAYVPPRRGCTVHARAAGFGEGAVFASSTGEAIEILLPPGKTVRGRLAVADLAAAEIRISGTMPLGAGAYGPDADAARPGPDGSFELVDLRSDVFHVLKVSVPGFGNHTTAVPAAEGIVDLGTIPLELEATLSGRVTTPEGAPARFLTVTLRPRGNHPEEVDRKCVTDEDGRYRIDGLRPGRWIATARGIRLELARFEVDLVPGPVHEDFVLDEGTRPLRGRIVPVPLDADQLVAVLIQGHVGYGRIPIAADGTFAVFGMRVDDATSVLIERPDEYGGQSLGRASCAGLAPDQEIVVPID